MMESATLMRGRPVPALLVALPAALFLAACPPAQEEPAEDPNAVERSIGDESALNALIADYMVAMNSGDADGVVASYAADAVRMPPDALPVSGRESIRQNIAQAFETADLNVQMQVIETEFSGELAYVRGTFLLTVTPKDGSPTTESEGNWMRLMRRAPDGRWLVAYSLWNFQS